MSPYMYSFNDHSKLWQHCKIDIWPILEIVTTAAPPQSWGARLHITGSQSWSLLATLLANFPLSLPCSCFPIYTTIPPTHSPPQPSTTCVRPALAFPGLLLTCAQAALAFPWSSDSHMAFPGLLLTLHPSPCGTPILFIWISHLFMLNALCMLGLHTQISTKVDLDFFFVLKGVDTYLDFERWNYIPNVVWHIVSRIMSQTHTWIKAPIIFIIYYIISVFMSTLPWSMLHFLV